MLRYFALLLFLISYLHGVAQQKYEREIGVLPEEVPENAVEFTDEFLGKSRIKWFKEEGLEGYSFEAKARKNRRKYSIEFSADGKLEDVEFIVQWRSIPSNSLKHIQKYLERDLGKYKIKKAQEQWIGDENGLLKNVNGEINHELTVNYELEVAAKIDGEYKLFEYLFSKDGTYVRRFEVILQMTDNLIY
ncbi:hypothetical protein [Jiulongibacter sp. NS-SX5]|uniref:hypothetical protein n=1 Tax=Jiulongibacter sp. NS-SX5 TaxID=3463854 RepID=UPI004059CEAA